MACKKIFWEDPYLRHLDTTITGVLGDTLTLKETILFAFSGGQASDRGTINGFEILIAEKAGTEIYYTLPPGHGLTVGNPVHLELDWPRRYRLMKLHFAAELVLEWVYQNCGHPEKVGANITEEKARVDFVWEGNISAVFPQLLQEFNELVQRDLEIESSYSDIENETRYWEITGFARVPCGGTHLKRTREIGSVKLKRRNPGNGIERIEIQLIEA